MKKLIALFTVALSMSATAATSVQNGVVTDNYKTIIKQIPYRVEDVKIEYNLLATEVLLMN